MNCDVAGWTMKGFGSKINKFIIVEFACLNNKLPGQKRGGNN